MASEWSRGDADSELHPKADIGEFTPAAGGPHAETLGLLLSLLQTVRIL